jgi:hypothetical protein
MLKSAIFKVRPEVKGLKVNASITVALKTQFQENRKPEVQLNNIYKFRLYLSENTLSSTKANWLMLFREIITVYFEDHMKSLNTLCGQSAEPFSIIANSTHNNDCVSKGFMFSGTLVTMGWDVLRLRMEEMASRFRG